MSAIAAAAATEAGGVDASLLGRYLDDLVAASTAGTRLDPGALAQCEALGARAAQDGVPLRALVDLYLSATWRAWRELPAVRDAPDVGSLHTAGEAVLRAADDAVAAAAEGFQAARRWAIRREEAMRREFVDDLLSGAAEPSRLLTSAEHFGVDVVGKHAVAVCSGERPFRDATPVVSRVEDAIESVASGSLVATKDGQLVCVLPASNARRISEFVAALTTAIGQGTPGTGTPARRGDQKPHWRCGVGRAYGGPAGLVRSYDEAKDAVRLADLLQLRDHVVAIADLLVYRVLLRDRESILDLIDTVLAPLRTARGGAVPLLDTVAAYAATGANAAATGRRLHLSVRAVTYRLARVHELTGYDPGVPEQLYVLHTAALGAKLLDWPS
ncbi:MAG: PucR family transcriptional regulator [Acidothermaceae bacterium]